MSGQASLHIVKKKLLIFPTVCCAQIEVQQIFYRIWVGGERYPFSTIFLKADMPQAAQAIAVGQG